MHNGTYHVAHGAPSMPRALFRGGDGDDGIGGGGGRTRCGEAAMSTVCNPSLLLPTSHEGYSRSPWLGLVGCRSCISDEEALVDVHVATKCAVARARQRVFERLVMVVYGGGVAVPVRLRRFLSY